MCLFVQNHDYQRHTEFVLNLLYTAGAAAAQRLVALNASMAAHGEALDGVGSQLTAVARQQVPCRTGHGLLLFECYHWRAVYSTKQWVQWCYISKHYGRCLSTRPAV